MNATQNTSPGEQQQKDESEEKGKRGFEQGEGQDGSESNQEATQEKTGNKGYEEDQPGHPVRSTGSTRKDQESGSVQPGDEREGKK